MDLRVIRHQTPLLLMPLSQMLLKTKISHLLLLQTTPAPTQLMPIKPSLMPLNLTTQSLQMPPSLTIQSTINHLATKLRLQMPPSRTILLKINQQQATRPSQPTLVEQSIPPLQMQQMPLPPQTQAKHQIKPRMVLMPMLLIRPLPIRHNLQLT